MLIKDCKIKNAITCQANENIVIIAKKLRDGKERHIIVLKKDKPIGIISTTDINNKVVAEKRNLDKTNAENIMTSEILIKDINEPVSKAYIKMIKDGLYSTIITENEKFKGILELREAMNHIIKNSPKNK